MTEPGKNVIIKKVIKKISGGAHGGSWKVAYADFVTAMMAFFLLMWLLSMTEPEKKMKLAQYFKDFTIFSFEGAGIMDRELPKMSDKPSIVRAKIAHLSQVKGGGKPDEKSVNAIVKVSEFSTISLKKRLKKIIKVRLAGFKSYLNISENEKGVRIDIMSLEDDPLFELGKAELTPIMKKIINKFYDEILRKIENNIIIEGHTDAIYYLNDKSTNWELSTARASSVMRELVNSGFVSDRISMIAGYASTQPIIEENPRDPRNRRISIVIVFPEKEESAVENKVKLEIIDKHSEAKSMP